MNKALLESLEPRIAPAGLAYAFSGGNSGAQTIQDLAVDSGGNSYVIGTFTGTVDFDPSAAVFNVTATPGQADVFVAKITDAGAPVWLDIIKYSGNSEFNNVHHIAVNNKGEVFIASDFGESAQFGSPVTVSFFQAGEASPDVTTTQNATPTGIYLAKISQDGSFDWAIDYGSGSAGSNLRDLAVDDSGHIYLAGGLNTTGGGGSGTVGFGSLSLTQGADLDLGFVLKLQDGASAPVEQWVTSAASADTNSFLFISQLAVDSSGKVAVTGSIGGPSSGFDVTLGSTTLTTTDAQDITIAQLDSAGNWLWAKSLAGGSFLDEGRGIAVDSTNNLYVTGVFGNTVDFDPGAGTFNLAAPGAVNTSQGFLLKLTSGGSFTSAIQIGGANGDNIATAQLDAQDNVYLAGSFSGTVDFDPGAGTKSITSATDSVFILTLDSTGAFKDVLTNKATTSIAGNGFYIDTSGNGGGAGFVVDPAGGIYFAGTFVGTFDADFGVGVKNLTSKGNTDYYISRFLPENVVAFTPEAPAVKGGFTVGGTGTQVGYRILTDASNNRYVAGLFTGTVDFDPGTGVSNLTSTDADGNVFVAKYNSTNQLVWARQVQMGLEFDSSADQVSINLGLDAAGNVYLAGEFNQSATFGSITINNRNPGGGSETRDVFVAKYDSSGTAQWAHDIGNSGGNEFLDNFAVSSTGKVLISGGAGQGPSFSIDGGSSLFTPLNSGFEGDDYVLQLSTSGTLDWVRQLAGPTNYFGEVDGITVNATGDVFIVGQFGGDLDFNLGGTADIVNSVPAGSDIYVARLSGTNGVVSWHQEYGVGDFVGDADLALNSAGKLVIGGTFTGAVNVDPGASDKTLISAGDSDIFILKLNPDGSYIDAISYGGAGRDFAGRLSLDAADNIYNAGGFSGTVNFDPEGFATLTTVGAYDLGLAVFTDDLVFSSAFRIAGFDSGAFSEETTGPGIDFGAGGVDIYVDANSNVFFTGGLSGSLDFDAGTANKTFSSKGGTDVVVVQFTPSNIVDATHTRSFNDANGDKVTITLTGPGTATYTLAGGVTNIADLQLLELADTTTASILTVSVVKNGSTTVDTIETVSVGPQHLKSITLAAGVTLGSALTVSGKIDAITLDDIADNVLIDLGGSLPYNITTDTTTPDTYNMRPVLIFGDVGSGVIIDVLDDNPNGVAGVGGGGLGTLTALSWATGGTIRTTQTIGTITIKTGDFDANLEIDKFHDGALTNADAGLISVTDGDITGDSFIEGRLAGLKAGGFDGNLQAGAISSIAIAPATATAGGSRDLAGIITIGGTAAPINIVGTNAFLGTLTASEDFLAIFTSANAIGNVTLKGDFKGSLQAPSIGTLTARSFDGTTLNDGFNIGSNTSGDIVATTGGIGALKTTSGVFANYDIQTPGAFGGITVALTNQTVSRVGIDNVMVNALSIGNLAVTLGGSTLVTAPAIDLVGIGNSIFTTTGTGNTTTTKGNIGTVTVKLTGRDVLSAWVGLDNVTFDAKSVSSTVNTLGNISVDLTTTILGSSLTLMDTVTVDADIVGTITGTAKATTGPGDLTGITNSAFTASGLAFNKAGTMGAAKVTLTSPTSLTSATGIVDTNFTANNALFGGITVAMTNVTGTAVGLDNVDVSAFSIGNIATTLAGGTLITTPAIDLTGITGSTFTALGAGTTAATAGKIGTVTATLTGKEVNTTWSGIDNSLFNADPLGSTLNAIGNVAVSATTTIQGGDITLVNNTDFTSDTLGTFTLTGKATSGSGNLNGWVNSDLIANGAGTAGKLGNVAVTLTGSSGQTASTAISGSTFTANNGTVGNLTTTQTNQAGTVVGITGLNVNADSIGNLASTLTGKTGLTIATATGIANTVLNADGAVLSKLGNIGTITAKVDLAGSTGTAIAATTLTTDATGTLGNLSFTALSSNANANLTALGLFDLEAVGNVGTFTVLAQNTSTATSGSGTVDALAHGATSVQVKSSTGSVGAVKVSAIGGATSTQQNESTSSFSILADKNIGAVSFITTKSTKVAGATAEGVRNTVITATTGDVGAFAVTGETTSAQVDGLTVNAGGKITSVAVSATTKANGDLINSTFRAGADNTAPGTTSLAAESLGAITVSGDITNSDFFAFGNIGAVKAEGAMADSLVVAGIKLGANNALSGGDDTFNRHASLTSLTVVGTLSTSSIVAGINHGGDGVWGQANDAVGAAIAGIAANGKIGAVTLGAASGAYTSPQAIASHNFAIESLGITSLKVGATTTAAAALAGGGYLDANTAATEDAIDTLVRILV